MMLQVISKASSSHQPHNFDYSKSEIVAIPPAFPRIARKIGDIDFCCSWLQNDEPIKEVGVAAGALSLFKEL